MPRASVPISWPNASSRLSKSGKACEPCHAQVHARHEHRHPRHQEPAASPARAIQPAPGQICISSVKWMELVYGAEKSMQVERNLSDVQGSAARLEVLPYENAAATHTGQIHAELARLGTPIGPYDQMTAGHARSQGLIVVTNNVREFQRIPGLRLQNWLAD